MKKMPQPAEPKSYEEFVELLLAYARGRILIEEITWGRGSFYRREFLKWVWPSAKNELRSNWRRSIPRHAWDWWDQARRANYLYCSSGGTWCPHNAQELINQVMARQGVERAHDMECRAWRRKLVDKATEDLGNDPDKIRAWVEKMMDLNNTYNLICKMDPDAYFAWKTEDNRLATEQAAK